MTDQTREAAPLLSTLVERLRGVYRLGVNDGAGLLNGSNEFVRKFNTQPIQHEAAYAIESLTAALSEAEERIKTLNADLMSRGDALVELGKSAVQIAAERDTALARIAEMEAGKPVAETETTMPIGFIYERLDSLSNPDPLFCTPGPEVVKGTILDLASRLSATPSAALARACTCHPSDNPPTPCAERFALSDCKATDLARTTINKDAVKRALSPAPTVKE